MRALVSATGPVAQRADAFGEEAVALAGVIASLQQTSVAPAVRRAADDLAASFIAPVADGGTDDLRDAPVDGGRQCRSRRSPRSRRRSPRRPTRSLRRSRCGPERFVPLSAPDAVLRYAGDFLPSWAGAISIDLLPAVLVLILVIVHGAIRREEDPQVADNVMTAADMIQAMRLYERMRREELATERLDRAAPAAPEPAPAAPVAAGRAGAPCPAERAEPHERDAARRASAAAAKPADA